MAKEILHLYATAAFGVEGLVAKELRKLGMEQVTVENGGVFFTGTLLDAFRCNLCMFFSDRIFIVLNEGTCSTFEDLFRLVGEISWEELLNGEEAINIACKCVRSQLMSERDCQAVAKKSVIERMKKATGRSVFPENGVSCPIQITIRNNLTRILLNTSGAALSRRGYRTWNGEAPLKENLAASLVELSPWKKGMPLHDPCCGTGTILIEAAFMASERAPGLNRCFAMEEMPYLRSVSYAEIRKEIRDCFHPESCHSVISGSDISREALDLAERHISAAGVGMLVSVRNTPLQELTLNEPEGVFICNPPYGERMSDRKSCQKLYRDLHILKDRHPGWHLCAISSDPGFERAYGKRADRKRRLYNGRLECNFYTFD